MKIPDGDIQTLSGRVPIRVRHELFTHPLAPVIRMVVTIYDRPHNPLALETFINVEDPQQRPDYAARPIRKARPDLATPSRRLGWLNGGGEQVAQSLW